VLRSVLEIYEAGQTLEALRRAESFAPLREWSGVKGCVLAARIALNAGAPRLALRQTVRARRAAPRDAEAFRQYTYELLRWRGPLAVWQALRAWPEARDTPAEYRAELLAVKGVAAAILRDFATAEALLSRAEAVDPGRPWIGLQRAILTEHLDRVEEALELAKAACALHPHRFYRPGVQACAHLLQLLDRDEDAIQLLTEANVALQSSALAAQLYSLLSENGRWLQAETALERMVELSPLLEEAGREWVSAERARVAYHFGRRADAAKRAAELDDDFHRRFAERLAADPARPERVQLDVTFVRQQFKTCAPATLAALGRFWQMPTEHQKLAESICYDGTPHWQQRQWAEQNGWVVREFRVTHETSVALTERGIPFAISVVEATSAHMLALIGFDRARGTLLMRDPAQPYVVEVPAEEFLKRYRAFGPHGMVFLPIEEGARIKGITLPDVEAYDSYHRFWLALVKHDRAGAAEKLEQMEARFPDHPLTWNTRLDLATYDANIAEQARALDRLLEIFPGNPVWLLQRMTCLRHAAREEQIRFLESACAAKDADPALRVELARALEGDARRLPQANQQVRRASRLRPLDASTVSVQADLCWEEGKFDEATELYRFAATLEGFREDLYQSWFAACRRTRHTDEAMAHLQDRFERFSRRSEQPALTLAWAWRGLQQPARACEVLGEAARMRPDDGYLMLHSASLVARLGQNVEADRLLQAARGKVRETDWLRAAAEIAEHRFDIAAALRWARDILRLEPLALDAHSSVARALARLEGPTVALAELKAACAQFPYHCGLKRLLVEWSSDSDPAAHESTVRELLRVSPSDAWARRELGLALDQAGRYEEALREASEAARIEPRSTFSFSVLGLIHRRCGQLDEARAQYRRAVELSVDNSEAVHALLSLAHTDAERREELQFIEQQLIEQVVSGDGLLAYLELARPVLDPESLLQSLRQAHQERPDLWHAWSALVSQFGHLGRLDEARDLAQRATERFPHLPRVWLDLAFVHLWRNEPGEEIAAAERAFEISPAWTPAALALTDALERRGKLGDARGVYERALQHSGSDGQLHACYAHLLWRQGQKTAAFAAVERALRLAPDYEGAWRLLFGWADECGEPNRTEDLARVLAREWPGEPRVWLMLARVLKDPTDTPARLEAVERALELDNRLTVAWDLKAELLTAEERFEDAIRACETGVGVCTFQAHLLRGRRAWIEACRRRLPEAVRLMRSVLAENQNFVWGWSHLVQWLEELGSLEDAGAALEQLLRLRPHDAWVSRQLALLRLKQQDTCGARKAFAAALRLDPSDVSAAQDLIDLQLRTNDLAGAASTLQVMQTHQPGAATLAAEIVLQLRRAPDRVPREALEALCRSPDPDPWPVNAAAAAMHRAGQTPDALRIFQRAVKSGSCNPQSAVAVIRLRLADRSTALATWFFWRLKPGEMQRRAAAPLVHGLAQLHSTFLLRCLLWRRRDVLARDDVAWGQVGHALITLNRMSAAARWLIDWRLRREVQPWMLFNLCLALRHLGRYEEANTIARHVLESWGHREGSAELRLFLAVEEALAGSLATAREHLEKVVVREDSYHDRELLALAKALVELQVVPMTERQRAFRRARQSMASHFDNWRMLWLMRDVRRTFRRSGRVFVREGGGWRARLWFGWKLNWQWLLLPIAPMALVVVAPTAPVVVALPPVLLGLLLWQVIRSRQR